LIVLFGIVLCVIGSEDEEDGEEMKGEDGMCLRYQHWSVGLLASCSVVGELADQYVTCVNMGTHCDRSYIGIQLGVNLILDNIFRLNIVLYEPYNFVNDLLAVISRR